MLVAKLLVTLDGDLDLRVFGCAEIVITMVLKLSL